MQSFWDYLRLRSRDSVLAGMQEALDAVDGDGTNHKDQEAARRLLDRQAAETPPSAVIEGETAARSPEAGAENPADRPSETTLAARVSEQMRDDVQRPDAFERRLEQTNPANSQPQAVTAPRKRGRPRKNP
jgi:hypothetical protein